VRYVALLRGVNVGEGARVPMKSLKALFENLGFSDVTTYLNSGNVAFDSGLQGSELAALIDGALERTFGQHIPVLVKTSAEIAAIAESIPPDWASDEGQQTYVAYLLGDADRPGLVDELPVKRQFMSIFYTPGAIVWNIKRADYNRSQITRIAVNPSYGLMTTRNINTARRLAQL
jgi:uncharacterized protein (DUF1697 family)